MTHLYAAPHGAVVSASLTVLDAAMDAVTSLKSKRQIATLKSKICLEAEQANINYGVYYDEEI